MGLFSNIFRKTDRKDFSSMSPQEVFINLLEVESDYLIVREQISKETIERVRQYQSMEHPGAFRDLENKMRYPQYRVVNKKIQRGGEIHEDMRLGYSLKAIRREPVIQKNDDIMKMAWILNKTIFLLIQNLAKIPIIYFCFNLPYLVSKRPSKEGLENPKRLIESYKGIENMLFEINKEQGMMEFITSEIVLQKVVLVLDVKEIDLPKEWYEQISQFLK